MNAPPHSPYRRAQIEWQEEAQDDRTDAQKLHDACRLVVDLARERDIEKNIERELGFNGAPAFAAAKEAADNALADLIWLLENQFGDEVDVELLAKALAS